MVTVENLLSERCNLNCKFGFQVGSRDNVEVDYSAFHPEDREAPVFYAASRPANGTRVDVGDEIVVKMYAFDQQNPWQTGIQRIALTLERPADEANEYFVGRVEEISRDIEVDDTNYLVESDAAAPAPPAPSGEAQGVVLGDASWQPVANENCEGAPEGRALQINVTVPDNPPSFLRLTATATDFTGNQSSVRAEFPTGTFSGIWRDEGNGQEVYLVQSGNNVSAHYVEWRACDHQNGTGSSSNTFFDFSGTLNEDRIEGEIEVCKWGTPDAGWIRVPVRLTVADDWKSLSGEWLNTIAQSWVPITFTWLRDL